MMICWREMAANKLSTNNLRTGAFREFCGKPLFFRPAREQDLRKARENTQKMNKLGGEVRVPEVLDPGNQVAKT